VRRETLESFAAPHHARGRVYLLALPCCAVAVLWFAAAAAVAPGGADGTALVETDFTSRLHAAARTGDVAAVERALDRRPRRVDAREEGSALTPLMTAARVGHVEVVRRLLARGAAVNAAVEGHGTALALAAAHNRADVVRVLLAAGADPNAGTPTGHTPIMFAARNADDSVAVLDLLLRAGAKSDARDGRGDTALTFATISGNTRTARRLREVGDASSPRPSGV
jgi:ankyrin repeat protein